MKRKLKNEGGKLYDKIIQLEKTNSKRSFQFHSFFQLSFPLISLWYNIRMDSQVKTTSAIREMAKDIKGPITANSLVRMRDLMYSRIAIRPYDSSTRGHEKEIRWKRTAGDILEDGYVYSGKACTDLVILFISLCRATGLETNFVKVTNGEMVHSIAEVRLDDGWYIFDVSRKEAVPVKGLITAESPYKGWRLWKKGRDAWDLGLVDFESIAKIS